MASDHLSFRSINQNDIQTAMFMIYKYKKDVQGNFNVRPQRFTNIIEQEA